jgi:hypothetical protein
MPHGNGAWGRQIRTVVRACVFEARWIENIGASGVLTEIDPGESSGRFRYPHPPEPSLKGSRTRSGMGDRALTEVVLSCSRQVQMSGLPKKSVRTSRQSVANFPLRVRRGDRMKSPTSVISLFLVCLCLAVSAGCGIGSSGDAQSSSSGGSGSDVPPPPASAT